MHIKATIVAYAFSMQCFKNAIIVAYVSLRVKLSMLHYNYNSMADQIFTFKITTIIIW